MCVWLYNLERGALGFDADGMACDEMTSHGVARLWIVIFPLPPPTPEVRAEFFRFVFFLSVLLVEWDQVG